MLCERWGEAAAEKRWRKIIEQHLHPRPTRPLITSPEGGLYHQWSALWDKCKGTQEVGTVRGPSTGSRPKRMTEQHQTVNKVGSWPTRAEEGIDLNNTGADKASRAPPTITHRHS
jgi:hypothetical protein